MTEVWLRANRRVLTLGLIVPVVLLCAGLVAVVMSQNFYVRAIGAIVGAIGGMGIFGIVWVMFQPRLAYRDGQLLVNVRRGQPYRVPIEVVEGFLMGQGPTMLPGAKYRNTEAATIVIRLAEAATDWSERETNPSLAKWCGGYITLRGTWCEPLSVDCVQRLNMRLAEVTGRI